MMTCDELRTAGTVAVVGAGPAGATLARLLQKKGFTVKVFERDASPSARPQGGSLDLRKSAGQLAVDEAGLTKTFERFSRIEAKEFKMLDSNGNPHPVGDGGTHEDAGPEIDRGDLRQLLLDSLSEDTVTWGQNVKSVSSSENGKWKLEFNDQSSFEADLVVGADGVNSKVRPLITSIRPRYIGMTMVAAVLKKELWRNSELSEILGEGSVMFADNNQTIFVQRCSKDLILLYYSMVVEEDWPKSEGFGIKDTDSVMKAVKHAYKDWSPSLVEMLTQVDGKLHRWPLSVMPADYTWETQNGLTMVGDSSHVMPPFTGKGVNLAMLDSLELAKSLTADMTLNVDAALQNFEKRMQLRTLKETGECLMVGKSIYGIHVDFSRP
ncbi:MAG: FAD-dependent monooxygenase [Leptolyngbya sp.]|nr:FAD-dependent monooxygenase [Candidatus Melainabacteria bacterium]